MPNTRQIEWQWNRVWGFKATRRTRSRSTLFDINYCRTRACPSISISALRFLLLMCPRANDQEDPTMVFKSVSYVYCCPLRRGWGWWLTDWVWINAIHHGNTLDQKLIHRRGDPHFKFLLPFLVVGIFALLDHLNFIHAPETELRVVVVRGCWWFYARDY